VISAITISNIKTLFCLETSFTLSTGLLCSDLPTKQNFLLQWQIHHSLTGVNL